MFIISLVGHAATTRETDRYINETEKPSKHAYIDTMVVAGDTTSVRKGVVKHVKRGAADTATHTKSTLVINHYPLNEGEYIKYKRLKLIK